MISAHSPEGQAILQRIADTLARHIISKRERAAARRQAEKEAVA